MRRIAIAALSLSIMCGLTAHAGMRYVVEDKGLPANTAAGVMYLSLKEALNIAMINNFDVQLARYDRMIKGTDLENNMSLYDTVMAVKSEYAYNHLARASTLVGSMDHDTELEASFEKTLRTGTDVKLAYGAERHASDSPFANPNPFYETYVKGSLVQPLLKNAWGGNDWRDILVTKIDIEKYDSETLDNIEGALADVEEAYWALVTAYETLEVTEELYEKASQFYDIIKRKEDTGSAEKTDLYAAEANLRIRQTGLLSARNVLKNRINALKLLINAGGQKADIRPTYNMDLDGAAEGLEDNMAAAFENRRDYKRARQEIKSKDIELKTAANKRWPQLDLEASLKLNGIKRSWSGSARNLSDNPDHGEYFAGLTFSVPLEGREARSAQTKAKYEKARAIVELARLEKTIAVDIDDKVRKFNLDAERLRNNMATEDLQRRKLQEEEKQYGYGRSDSDRIIRFQEDYLEARVRTLAVKLDAAKSLIDLYLAENVYFNRRGLAADKDPLSGNR